MHDNQMPRESPFELTGDPNAPRRHPHRHRCIPADDPSPLAETKAEAYARFGSDELPAEQAAARLDALEAKRRTRPARPTIAGLRRQGFCRHTARVIVRYRASRLTSALPTGRSREHRAPSARRTGSRRGISSRSSGGGDPDEPEPPRGRQPDLAGRRIAGGPR